MNNTIEIYRPRGQKKPIEVRIESESVWLTAHQMAELFQIDRSGIVRHINNIYRSKELPKASTCAKNAQVAAGGKVFRRRTIKLTRFSRKNSMHSWSGSRRPNRRSPISTGLPG